MFDLPGVAGTLANLAVIVVGFGAIIFVHELGHFLAAKWAGIRVLAFSMGMGPVLVSYRKGMGWRKGSSEPDYRRLLADGAATDGISPTEYRLSALPLGGYVKMLGQEDANPGAVSEAPDSYQNRPVWKRMVVICAGVVMNVIAAAVLFVVVFMVGLKVQPPVVGYVADASPAAVAEPVGRDDVGPGLLPEDRVLQVGDREMRSFTEVVTEVAMSGRREPVRLLVERPGLGEPIEFVATARPDQATGLLDLGIAPPSSPVLARWEETELRDRVARMAGLGGVAPGDRLVRVGGQAAARPDALVHAAERSGGTPFEAVFVSPDGAERGVTLTPERGLQAGEVVVRGERVGVEHVLGLLPLIRVSPDSPAEMTRQGLEPGDVLVRIGEMDAPSMPMAMGLIRAHAGQALQLEVLRGGERVVLDVKVSRSGTIGFMPDSTARSAALVALPAPIAPLDDDPTDDAAPATASTPASRLIARAGTRIVSVGDRPVESLTDVALAVLAVTDADYGAGRDSFSVPVTLELPLPAQPDGRAPTQTAEWTLSRAEVESLRETTWTLPGGASVIRLFEMEQTLDKASGPLEAVGRGVATSRRVMNQTYLTFLRLFQGTMKVSHLKGPVGIAHLGTQVADQGFIWVLFFLGLVSVNLAVINFLPLPIVDGGQFLMLCYEGVRRRPVPIAFQNAATLVGVLLIGAVFLIVTFHDLRALFGV